MRTAVSILSLLLSTVSLLRAQDYTAVRVFPNLVLTEPVGLIDPGDGSNRLFVVEQSGVIKVFDNTPDVDSQDVFLDLRGKVTSGGEMGLLGLAFSPNYRSNGYFYVYYTAVDPLRTVISRFRVRSDNPRAADSASEKVILTYEQPDRVHKGGQLAFGPDGYLYISSGDGGWPKENSQSLMNLLGKILRIDVNSDTTEDPYTIPPDNPFVDSTALHAGLRPEIYAYGLRNPWRFSFDHATGRIWCGEVGQQTWEEVDIIERGRNYGWPIREGFHCFDTMATCDTTGLVAPLIEYEHIPEKGYAITGGYVYRGPSLPSLEGKYIYADFVSGRVWSLTYDGTSLPVNTLICESGIPISSFGVDSANELYICSYGGAIYKLEKTSGVREEGPAAAFELTSQPNPIATKGTIAYTIDRAMHVSVTLHDLTGREVRRLAGGMQIPGPHTIELDASGLPAGSYYCRVAAGDTIATRRILVAR